MEMIQQIAKMFLQVGDKVLNMLEGEFDYSSFQLDVEKLLNELGRSICREVMESADEWYRDNPKERKGWVVQRRNESKSVLTPFGQMHYQRTYFRHKGTKKYAHLVDLAAGRKPHAKTELTVQAKLVGVATEMSYNKAGKGIWSVGSSDLCVSGQTVMNTIRRLPLANVEGNGERTKSKASVIHIQADEDHVHKQSGGTALAKLVYTTSGYVDSPSKRKRLSDVRYIAGLYKDNEPLCQEVYESLDEVYGIDLVEKIYVYGDGAPWIKELADYLGATFLLDKYHINKYIKECLAFCPELRGELWKAVNSFDLKGVKQVFKKAKKAAITDREQKRVAKCRKYLVGNWHGILAWKEQAEQVVGCSAEGHVSHVLSARLSSRPMAWSEKGIDQMAKLRAMRANGISVEKHVLQQAKPNLALAEAVQHAIPAQREILRKVSGEMFDNMPALRGSTRSIRKVLRAISTTIINI